MTTTAILFGVALAGMVSYSLIILTLHRRRLNAQRSALSAAIDLNTLTETKLDRAIVAINAQAEGIAALEEKLTLSIKVIDATTKALEKKADK